MMTAQEIIQQLNLAPLPNEGGFFLETYVSKEKVAGRSFQSAIYYLITPQSFSALHRLKQDEIFHFYLGDPVQMMQIQPTGELRMVGIGTNLKTGERPQVVVSAGIWQGTKLKEGGSWALLGTTVSPAFDFSDFELGTRDKMWKLFPQHRESIQGWTR